MTSNRSVLDRAIQFVQPRLVRDFAPPPTPIAPDLWCLDRRMRMPGGPMLPTRSTIIRLPSHGLLVVSPPPVDAGGLERLDALGAVEEIVVPNSFHYLHAREFLARYPGATLRLAPALHERIAGLPGEELTAATPAAWGTEVAHQILGPVRGMSEVALFHAPSATLILADVAFNMVSFASRFERAAWRLSGVPAGFGPSRTARTFLLNDRGMAAAFLARVLEWPFRRVLVAHGEVLESNAVDVFRRAFASFLAADAGAPVARRPRIAMSDGPPRDWADAHAWDAYFKAEVLAGRMSRSDGPLLRFLPITRKMGGRVWFPGCGLDEGPPIYAMRGRHVVATDFSRVAVHVQRRLADYFLTHVPAGTTPGTFEALEQDFTRERPDREFDVVVNVRAFHGLSADAMRAAARQFHAALRPGGTCLIDTINVHGELRDAIEDSLIAAGFYVPYQESVRWYREQLKRTGIVHAMPLGRPRIPSAGQYPAEQFDERAQRDQAVLDSIRAEYEARCQNEAAAVQAMADDPTTITAQVVYSSG